MSYGALLASAIVLLVVAAYAQRQVSRFTRQSFVWPLRLGLAGLGLAVGYVFAATGALAVDEPHLLLVMLIGFGLVHLPAAAILVLKRARGSERS